MTDALRLHAIAIALREQRAIDLLAAEAELVAAIERVQSARDAHDAAMDLELEAAEAVLLERGHDPRVLAPMREVA